MTAKTDNRLIVVPETKLKELLPIILRWLNPDDWAFLEGTLLYTRDENFSRNAWIRFFSYGFEERFLPPRFQREIVAKNDHGIFEVLAGKKPEKIIIWKADFLSVYQLIGNIFAWGYELTAFKAFTGSEYPYDGLEIGASLPGYYEHQPGIRINLRTDNDHDHYNNLKDELLTLLRLNGAII